VLRVLLAVNAVLVCAALVHSNADEIIARIAEGAVWVEPVALGVLVSLCALRGLLRRLPVWAQRGAVALVAFGWAVLVTGGLAQLLGETGFGWMQAPIWRRAVVAAALAMVLLHYFELRARASSPALSEARLQALQARIRPHFLFNSLNAVLTLVRTDPRRAERTLEDLADLFRVLMRDTRKTVLLEDEVALCRQYLEIESLRLGERLRMAWEIDDVLPRIQVPSLLLQPLLENAILHGVEPNPDGGEISISVVQRRDRVHIRIANPLAPKRDPAAPRLNPKPGNQMALENIRERLRLLYDLAAELNAREEHGLYIVQLTLPAKPS
jgi:two-component system sensor histidine kinase AlgZ